MFSAEQSLSLESAVELVVLLLKLAQLYVWPNFNETIPNPLYGLFTAENIISFIRYIVLEILLNLRVLYLLLIIIIALLVKSFREEQNGIVVMPFDVSSTGTALSGKAISELLIADMQELSRTRKPGYNTVDKTGYASQDFWIMSRSISLEGIEGLGNLSVGTASLNVIQLITVIRRLLPWVSPARTITGSIQKYGQSYLLVALMEDREVHSWIVKGRAQDTIPELVEELAERIVKDAPLLSLRTLEADIKKRPDDSKLWHRKGGLLANLGRKEEAREAYKRAIKLNPNFASAHYNLGNLLDDLGRKDEAEEQYRLAIKADPNFAPARSNLGNLLYYLGRKDEAEEQYRLAIKADPNRASAHYNLGNLLIDFGRDLGRKDEAEKQYRQAIKADPNFAPAHYNLGTLLKDLGRKDEAEKQYRLAIKADPNLALAHYNLGNLLKDLGRNDEAEEQYRLAIKADPNLVPDHYLLGTPLKDLGRTDEAEGSYFRFG